MSRSPRTRAPKPGAALAGLLLLATLHLVPPPVAAQPAQAAPPAAARGAAPSVTQAASPPVAQAAAPPTIQGAPGRVINFYRYILSIDVPQPPALVGTGAAPEPLLLGSTHKPFMATVALTLAEDGRLTEAVAVDFAPWFVFSGGPIDLETYRSMSVAGRLRRVLMKAVISAGLSDAFESGARSRWGFGVRLTLHDPHDVAGSALPDEVARAFAAAGVALPDPRRRDLRGLGIDVDPLYAAARERIRARAGDAQVSGGWAVSTPAGSGEHRLAGPGAGAEAADDPRHTFWLAAQYTAGARYDVIANLHYRAAFGDQARLLPGLGVLVKGDRLDAQAGALYDTEARRLHPTGSLSARLAGRLGARLSGSYRPVGRDLDGDPELVVGLQARWFYASDRR